MVGKRFTSLRRHKLLAVLLLVGLYFLVILPQFSQMDSRFFMPSTAGLRGLAWYLSGSYSRAAVSYRQHLRDTVAAGASFGDPAYDTYLRGDSLGARSLARQAIQQDNSRLEGLLTLGELAIQDHDLDQAQQVLVEALALEPRNYDALLLSSVAYAQAGQYDQAVTAVSQAVRQQRTETRITAFLSVLHMTGDLAGRPTRERPNCLLAHYYRYLRIFDSSNASLAITSAERAIEEGDRPGDAWVTIGIVQYREGAGDEVLPSFLKALEADQRNQDAYVWAAKLYGERGDLENEYRIRKAAFQALPEETYADYMPFLVDKIGDYTEALRLSLANLHDRPQDADVLYYVGLLYHRLGDEDRARRYLEAALQYDASNAYLYLNYGALLLDMWRPQEAIAVFSKAIALRPSWPELYTNLGNAYVDARRFREAATAYETAIRLGDNGVPIHSTLCVVYEFSGAFERAVTECELVLARDPGNTSASRMLTHAKKNVRAPR